MTGNRLYAHLLKRMILPLGERLRGTHVLDNLRQLEKSQWWAPEQLRALQVEKLRALLAHAGEHVPYYRQAFRQAGFDPRAVDTVQTLQCLPILTKREVRRYLHHGLLADNYAQAALIPQHTSGSTGDPMHYYNHRAAQDRRMAATLRLWRWAGYAFGDRWVRLGSLPRAGWQKDLEAALSRCCYLQFREADDIILRARIAAIQQARPAMIRGYPSALYLIAQAAQKEGSDLKGPTCILTTGSTLYPHYRQVIEATFGCRVYDHYGGEGTVISGQCEHGAYHIHDEGVIVEFLTPEGRPARPGELARIVLTDLNNYAMPFIRYEIGDLGVPSEATCPCGRELSLMESVVGRDTDIVVTPNGRYLNVHFFGVLLWRASGVEQYQITQDEIARLEVALVVNERFTAQDGIQLVEAIRAAGGEELQVDLRFVEHIPPAPSGKRRHIISKVGQEYFGPRTRVGP